MNRIDPKRVRSFADRVERINEEIAALNADKREIFAEAREAEYDVKALKTAIKIRQQKANDSAGFQEHEHLVELYLDALDSPEETGHARAPAPRTRQTSETPAPTSPPEVDGGQPQQSAPADLPQTDPSTSGSRPVDCEASEGAPPADETVSPSLSAPEEATCTHSQAGSFHRPSDVLADGTEGDGLAGGGDGAAVATPVRAPREMPDIPGFLDRRDGRQPPWMEAAD